MRKLGPVSSFTANTLTELNIDGLSLLLIHQDDHFYLIENKCGHFGVPLIDGEVTGSEITCSQHGIRFSLVSGEVVNRKYENCDMIKTYTIVRQGDDLYFPGT